MNRTHKHLSAAAVATLVALGGPAAMAVGAPSTASPAEITVDGCTVESSEDISSVEFLDGDESLTTVEDVDAEAFDLSTAGVEEFDAVEVKAGTTVEEFSGLSCPAPADTEEQTTLFADPEAEESDEETEIEESDEEAEIEESEDSDDAETEGVDVQEVSAGVNGHGEADERHDGRHEKWGGTAAEDETEEETEVEESDEEEFETEDDSDDEEEVEDDSEDDEEESEDEDEEDDEDDDES